MRTIAILVTALLAQSATAATLPSGVDPASPAVATDAVAAAIPTPPVPILTVPLVVTDIVGTPPTSNPNDSTNLAVLQINGTDPVKTGYLEFKYGANGKGVYNTIVKTRGVKMNDFAAVQSGDRIVTTGIQAGSGWQAGHLGTETWVVDGTVITPNEVNGRWTLATDTGTSLSAVNPAFPTRFALMSAIIANSFQQVYFPGGNGGANANPAIGSNFGGWVVIGAGAPNPGFAPLKFRIASAATLTVPEAGAFEVDANGRPYFTAADNVRRSFDLDDTGTPTVATAAGAGANATASVDAGGSAGAITLVTGSSPAAGAVVTLTYAHPYSAASYPVFSFGNANGPATASQLYIAGTRAGFTLSTVNALAANTTYVITYQAPGR